MEAAMIAKTRQEELQALAFNQPVTRRVINLQVREIWLARDRAKRGELRANETRQIKRVRMRVLHPLKLRLIR